MKFKYLNELAVIAVSIDEGKNISDGNVFSITDCGVRLVAHMKQLGLNVGTLQGIFIGMQLMSSNRVVLIELMDMAYEEMTRLLGIAVMGIDVRGVRA